MAKANTAKKAEKNTKAAEVEEEPAEEAEATGTPKIAYTLPGEVTEENPEGANVDIEVREGSMLHYMLDGWSSKAGETRAETFEKLREAFPDKDPVGMAISLQAAITTVAKDRGFHLGRRADGKISVHFAEWEGGRVGGEAAEARKLEKAQASAKKAQERADAAVAKAKAMLEAATARQASVAGPAAPKAAAPAGKRK